MGSPPSERVRFCDEGPRREVQISRPFYVGRYEVTEAQWWAVMGNKQFRFDDCKDCPEERAGTTGYRLSTEAEWEYACRAGSQAAYSFGDDPEELEWFAWYEKNSGGKTHPVGEKRPNAWGLYDMLGNVWEWCQDWYGDYASGSVSDPTGPSSGPARVQCGGSWYNDSGVVRCAYRGVAFVKWCNFQSP